MEIPERGERAARSGGIEHLADGRPQGNIVLARHGGERVDGSFSDAARGRIDHPEQGDIVVRKNRQARVGERVLHLGALVKREAAQHAIAHAARAHRLFKRARLRVRAVEHGNVNGRVFAMKDADRVGNVLGLGFRVAPFKKRQIVSRGAGRLEIFSETPAVVRDDARGGVENFLRRAVILFQANDARAGIILVKAENVADIGAAPAVDGLILVADDAQVARLVYKQPQQVILHAVGVLIFVDVNVAETRLPGRARFRKFPQHLNGAQQEIVKIESAGLAENVFVLRVHFRGGNSQGIVVLGGLRGDLRGSLRMILREADALEKAANFLARILDVQMFEGKFHGRDLVVGVKNLEIARQPEAFRFAAQQPCGKRVKRSDPRIVERLSLADEQIADALFHLRRGFIGERHGEDRAARHALLDQVRDPVGNGARLARARPGKNQDGTINSGCGFKLSGIQFVKECHIGRRARLGSNILSDRVAFGKFALAQVVTHFLRSSSASTRWFS